MLLQNTILGGPSLLPILLAGEDPGVTPYNSLRTGDWGTLCAPLPWDAALGAPGAGAGLGPGRAGAERGPIKAAAPGSGGPGRRMRAAAALGWLWGALLAAGSSPPRLRLPYRGEPGRGEKGRDLGVGGR